MMDGWMDNLNGIFIDSYFAFKCGGLMVSVYEHLGVVY